jgi:hypothetical protein
MGPNDLAFYPFDVAVCLDKALGADEELAFAYLRALNDAGVMLYSDYISDCNDEFEVIESAKKYLMDQLYSFEFKRSAEISKRIASLAYHNWADASNPPEAEEKRTRRHDRSHKSRQSKIRR